jgi:3-methylcrotonyl-CoA carboxylase alpha subunit
VTPLAIRRVLVANRGEIAVRIFRTCQRMGIGTVAVYSDADAGALHVAQADQAVRIGPPPARESYLRMDAVIEAARRTGADAIHPGYGFLSENAEFAEAVAGAGLIFIGPRPAAIRAMGSKAGAKALMAAAGVPIVPGYHGDDQSDAHLDAAAAGIGFPVLIKASAGGGGKGMRIVRDAAAFAAELAGARREAQAAFGDSRVLIEKYLQRPRHIEVQIFGDAHGNVVHMGTRDCSVQRRHQKVIEEAPAPNLPDAMRTRLHDAAIAAARAVDYVGAGTIEFIAEGPEFFFMEMNTRIQVEHRVTEMITYLDLVEWQIRVASGEPLSLPQAQIRSTGHAIQARLYAEDPDQDFRPATGRIHHLRWPRHGWIDAGIRQGDEVTGFYDPMLAKLIVHGPDRAAARAQMAGALSGTRIAGVVTNLGFLRRAIAHPDFAAAELDTGFIARHAGALMPGPGPAPPEAVLAAALPPPAPPPAGPWQRVDGFRLWGSAPRRALLRDGGATRTVLLHGRRATLDGTDHTIGVRHEADHLVLELDGIRHRCTVMRDGNDITVDTTTGIHRLHLADPLAPPQDAASAAGHVASPIPGRVVQVLVTEGDTVTRGQVLVIVEAMKTELRIVAPSDGRVAKVNCAAGDSIAEGADLVDLDAPAG